MLTPDSESALAEMIQEAQGPLSIRGGGTSGLAPVGEALSLSGLSGITLYEPGALTLVARAGTPLAEIEATLAEKGQRLAFEPMDRRPLMGSSGTPTIGGTVASNLSGPRRIQAGACRDALIGVRFVDGRGEILKNGGRVMKNVTGYDLVKLMAGAHGTLGVLTEVSFKLLPAPEAAASVALEGLEIAQGVAALGAALGSPYEVSGAAIAGGRTLVRLEGFAASVAERAAALAQLWAPFGSARIDADPEAVAAEWAAIRDVRAFADQPGDLWRVSVKPSDAPALAARLGEAAILYDWGGGLMWCCLPEGTGLRAAMGPIPGHATLWRASAATRQRLGSFHPEAAPVAALSAGLRAQFDPRGILNAGLMG